MNLDPQLTQVIRETECMMKLKLEIPETARLLLMKRDILKSTSDDLRVSNELGGSSFFSLWSVATHLLRLLSLLFLDGFAGRECSECQNTKHLSAFDAASHAKSELI